MATRTPTDPASSLIRAIVSCFLRSARAFCSSFPASTNRASSSSDRPLIASAVMDIVLLHDLGDFRKVLVVFQHAFKARRCHHAGDDGLLVFLLARVRIAGFYHRDLVAVLFL